MGNDEKIQPAEGRERDTQRKGEGEREEGGEVVRERKKTEGTNTN